MKNPVPSAIIDLLPRKQLFIRFLIFSLLVWFIVIAAFFLFRFQKKLDAGSNMGAAFGSRMKVSSAPAKKIDEKNLNDFDAATHLNFGTQALKSGDAEKAVHHFQRASIFMRNNPALNEKLGDAYFLLGEFEKAERSYGETLKDQENNAKVLAKAGYSIFYQRKTREGIRMIRQSIQMDSSCGECYSLLARALSNLEPEKEGALEAFFHSMVLAPQNPDVYYYYAKYLMNHNRYKESVSALKHVINLYPLHTKAHARLGMAYYYLKEYKKAKHEYEITLKINPDDFNTLYNLGELLYTVENDSVEAMQYFQKAIDQNPEHYKAFFKKGIILFRNAQYKEAAVHFLRAHSIEPSDIRVLLQLAAAYEKLDQWNNAVKTYDQILKIDPLHRIASHKIDIISSGRTTH